MATQRTLNTKRSNKPHRTQETRLSVLVPQLSLLWMLRQRRDSRHCIPPLVFTPLSPSLLLHLLLRCSGIFTTSWQLCSFSTSQLHGLPATRMHGTTDVCVLNEVKSRGTLLSKWQYCVVPHVSRRTTNTRRQAANTKEENMSVQCFERVVRWYNETKATKGHPEVADEGGAPSDKEARRVDAAGLTARHCAHLRRRAADWARWEAGKGRPPTGVSKSAKRRMRKQAAKEARTSA